MKTLKTIFSVMLLLAMTGTAVADQYDPGIDYLLVRPVQPTTTGDKVEVLEVFWYGCPHCYHFEPALEKWVKHLPDTAVFKRMPAIFPSRPGWEVHARAFYTAKLLGVLDKIHKPLFDAIHKERRRLFDKKSLADFFAEHGVSKEEFNKTYDSFAVDTRVRRAKEMSERYGVTGVPSLIINGKYRLSASVAGSNPRMLKIADYLIDKEAKGK